MEIQTHTLKMWLTINKPGTIVHQYKQRWKESILLLSTQKQHFSMSTPYIGKQPIKKVTMKNNMRLVNDSHIFKIKACVNKEYRKNAWLATHFQ